MHRLAEHTRLVDAIDRHVEVLKVALPYRESDHVLGIAYNVLCGGTCLQDIEQRRQDEVYLDALGAQRIPDPTTAGDFCRRFDETTIEALQTAINVPPQLEVSGVARPWPFPTITEYPVTLIRLSTARGGDIEAVADHVRVISTRN